jgi:hypothetical protein
MKKIVIYGFWILFTVFSCNSGKQSAENGISAALQKAQSDTLRLRILEEYILSSILDEKCGTT